MTLRFLHCADVHLGAAPFGAGADPAVRDVQRRAFAAACDVAVAQECALMLIAGDLFDGAQRDHRDVLFVHKHLTELGRKGVKIAIVLGNHDAAAAAGVDWVPRDAAYLFPSDAPAVWRLEEHRLAIVGQSYARREETRDLAAAFPPAAPGWTTFGLLHTALDGRDGHAPYAPTTPDRLAALGYDYWALGHVHRHEIVRRDPWIVFPGCLQGRSIRDAGAKGCVLGVVDGAAVRDVAFIPLDQLRWTVATVDLTGVDPADGGVRGRLVEALSATAATLDGRAAAVRLSLIGFGPAAARLLADPDAARAEAAAAAQEVGDALWIEKLDLSRLQAAEPQATPDAADLLAELAAIMAALAEDPGFQAEATALLTDGPWRQAVGAAPADAPLAALLATARAQALAMVGDGA